MINRFVEYDSLEDKQLPFHQRPANFPESRPCDLWQLFYKQQWRYCPVELTYNMGKRLTKDVILPFSVERRLGRGGSAYVYEIRVDRAYNRLSHQANHHAVSYHLVKPKFSLLTLRSE